LESFGFRFFVGDVISGAGLGHYGSGFRALGYNC